MKTTFQLGILLLASTCVAKAQFAPQAGITGSTAIHKTSSLFKGWGNKCAIKRGLQHIEDASLGYTTTGDSTSACGIADGEIVSLGDSGSAVVQFTQPLYNGAGADFAVFENGFQNPANPEESFMELAFVEVSSDGEHFFRFPATSNTPTAIQIRGAGDYSDARKVNNLAGKYVAQYGTPFDLEELKGTSGLDVNNITHIRVIDVIGSLTYNSASDINSQKINDPYPTPFPTGGFDLDAIGAIHITGMGIKENKIATSRIFPNPATDELFIQFSNLGNEDSQIEINDLSGKLILKQNADLSNKINIENLSHGMYSISLSSLSSKKWIGKFCKQ